MKILVKYATRGRASMFAKAIQSLRNTMLTKDYQILISADEDDKTMNNPQVRKYCNQTPRVKIVYGRSESKVHAINRDLDQASPWEILVNMSDDMKFVVRGWDKKIITNAKAVWGDSLDWFAHWSDGYTHAALPTMSIMGWTYFERDNYIYHPSYKSFSCDAEAMYVAMARGCYKYFPEVLFHHQHPGNSKRFRVDHLYRSNSRHSQHDIKTYFERLNNDFHLNIPGPHPWDQYKTNGTTSSDINSVHAGSEASA